MSERISRLLIGLGVFLLLLSGLFLMIGHDPESFVLNYQAEVLANFAYGLFTLGFLLSTTSSMLR